MYHLQVLTPEDIIFDDEVHSLVAPGADGYLGVLTDHASLITLLKEGNLVITDKKREKHFFKVSAGFLEVNHNEASVLVDTIEATTFVDMGLSGGI